MGTVKPRRVLRERPGQTQQREPWQARRTGEPVGPRAKREKANQDTPMADAPGARATGSGRSRPDPVGGSRPSPVGGSPSQKPVDAGSKEKGESVKGNAEKRPEPADRMRQAIAERAAEVQKLVDYLLDQRVEVKLRDLLACAPSVSRQILDQLRRKKVPTEPASANLGEVLNEEDLEEAWGEVFTQMEKVLEESSEVDEEVEGEMQVDSYAHVEAVDDVPTDQALAIAGLALVPELRLGAAALEVLLRGVCLDSGSQIVTIAKSTFDRVRDGCAVKELSLTMPGAGGNHRRLQGLATGLRFKVFDLEWRVQAWILDDAWRPAPYELLLGQPFLLAARTETWRDERTGEVWYRLVQGQKSLKFVATRGDHPANKAITTERPPSPPPRDVPGKERGDEEEDARQSFGRARRL
ncbi:hypothetical protein HK101_004396 [Irineochytrium annulatum]|nr:hypothetical protein HK101_004396 [Irineochytrium annulatum]